METKTLSIKAVREVLGGFADTVGKNKNGEIVVRHGFFYTHGRTAESFGANCLKQLRAAGINANLIEVNEVWKPFRGSASTANSSHFSATFF